MSKTIVLDYDGVILDSLVEKYYIGIDAYTRLEGGENNYDLREFDIDYFVKSLARNRKFREFGKMVSYIGIAGENACAIKLIEEKTLPYSKKEFRVAISKIREDYYDNCHNLVLNLRANYGLNMKEKYNKLCPPFRDVIKFIKKHSNNIRFEICTTKSLENVEYFNNIYGISDCFGKITVVEDGRKKIDRLEEICEEHQIERRDVVFIDDILDNLCIPYSKGFLCYHASWGFEGTTNGIVPTIAIDELETIIDNENQEIL